jgi:hypothetical protein
MLTRSPRVAISRSNENAAILRNSGVIGADTDATQELPENGILDPHAA